MDIRYQLELLKKKLEQDFDTETSDRKAARSEALKKLVAALGEFDILSQKVGMTEEQMAAISQLQKIMFSLGEIKGPEK